MKRWTLFLVLFLAGLAILWWVDRRTQPTPKPDDPGTAPAPNQGVLTEFTPDEKGHKVRGSSGGEIIADTFDAGTIDNPGSGKLLYRITAKNSESLGEGVYRLDSLVLKVYVRGTDTLRMELAADTARAKIKIVPALEFDPDYVMQLDGVVATLHADSPFVPVTLRVPHLQGSLAGPSFHSEDRVEVSGTGLSAEGVGLSYDGKLKELKLVRDTHASLILEDGTPAKLSAAGGLTITSLAEDGLGSTRAVARDKAHLTFEGKEPLALDADEVTLDAQVTRVDKDTHMQPSRVGARGNVLLSPRDGKFFGDSAELELDLDGRPKKATFKGAPRVELVLRDIDAREVPGATDPKSTDLPVTMLGEGPLDVTLAGDAHFDFLGPATLILPSLGMDLIAQEKLSGTRRGDGPFGRLDATGTVEAHAAGAEIKAPALSIERELASDGKVAASLTTTGDTHAVGPLEDGGTFDLTAARGLEFVRSAKSFQVPLAHEVELTVTGPDAFHAKAREVRDLDYETRSMNGIGDVLFENADGRGTGQRVLARSKSQVEVFGAPSAPAHLEFEQGTLDAESITFQDDRLRAEGEARAEVGAEGNEYRLHSRWIEVERRPEGEGQALALTAGGQVGGSVADGERTIEFTADDVQARAFSATPKVKKLESRGLEANGNVDFHVRGDEELDGNGERLVIEPDRSGRLYPAENRRVSLTGRLPKDELQFRMTAGPVHFAPQSLSAEDPAIEIMGVQVPLGGARAPSAAPLHAVAGAMSIDPDSMLFTEGVYVGQTETPETTWSLDSENLVLTGASDAKVAPGNPRFHVSNVIAWGGFQARFADQVLARGTTLLLDREENRLTLRGEPSEFDVSDWRVKTKWLEIDLTTGFWRASKGSAHTLNERKGSYEFRFEAMEPLKGVDSRIEVVREPSFIDLETQRETRASWALFWLDEARLAKLTTNLLRRSELGAPEAPEEGAEAVRLAPSGLVQQLQTLPFLKWVREAYFEGNIEVLDHGQRHVGIDALYVDLAEG
ncbi:MAG TPA: hypothetical protein VM509_07815, partial [Planctomycetota bacterium]|nr:hypothetical protein [Planctomycetota bacterium]